MNHSEEKKIRLSQIARKLNVGTDTIVDFLVKKGFSIDNKPNTRITVEQFDLLAVEFVSAGVDKQEAAHVTIGKGSYKGLVASPNGHGIIKIEKVAEAAHKERRSKRHIKREELEASPIIHYETTVPTLPGLKPVGKLDWEAPKDRDRGASVGLPITDGGVVSPPRASTLDTALVKSGRSKGEKINLTTPSNLKGPTVVGKINFQERKKRSIGAVDRKSSLLPHVKHQKPKTTKQIQEGVSTQEIESQIKKTLAKLQRSGEGVRAKYKKDRRAALVEIEDKRQRQEQEEGKVLKITEFIAASELALLMGVTVNEVLSTCMSLGMIVSINQRLDAEIITLVADEFGYRVAFVDLQDEEEALDQEEVGGELLARSPIVTIMGHVDHGKTSLLDYIRSTKVAAKEVGGITQHIGAYDIVTGDNQRIVFLDTPGHEAFTAMRTRGASITDVVIIVVAADDSIMPQTKESISHAQVAGCPMIIAINKVDKPQANPEKVKEDLANLNILVEEWGGKYQCQEISAKTGQGVNELLDKILLEASLLGLKATPLKKARGTIIESFLDPGRGYVVSGIVQDGTLQVGDTILAGVCYGRVKAMLNHQGKVCAKALPATPVQVLGLNGAPRAGDTFRVMGSMKEASELGQKRQQLLREQTFRTKGHLTLDEIGRRLAVGNFKELKIIIKGDVDGSIEALADALLRLSHEEVQVNVVHKCVGAISESDVLLAVATGAIIIAFHIKPSIQVKKLAEKEGVEIRQYAVIYSAIEDIGHRITGLLAPTIEEVTTGKAEIKKVFPISKVGNIAGCQVQTGFVKQANPIRVIRKNEILFVGSIHTIKHGAEGIKQAKSGSECGIHIKNFDAIEVGDIIEGFERREVKREM